MTEEERRQLKEAADLLQKHAVAGPTWEPVAFLHNLASREQGGDTRPMVEQREGEALRRVVVHVEPDRIEEVLDAVAPIVARGPQLSVVEEGDPNA